MWQWSFRLRSGGCVAVGAGASGKLRGMAGEAEEHVVQRRAAKGDVVDGNVRLVQLSHDLNETARAATCGDGDASHVVVEGVLTLGRAREQRDRARQLAPLADNYFDPLSADLRLELVGRTAGDDLSVVHHDDLVGELIRLFEVLRGEEKRGALAHETADDVPHAETTARVEPRCGFVEEQDLWPAAERAGEIEPAAHPAGVRLDDAIRGIGEPELLEQLGGAPARLTPGELIQPAEQLKVLATGEVLVDRRVLTRETHDVADLLRLAHDVESADRRSPGIGPQQRREDPHRGRLAGTIRAEHPENAAFG